MNGIDSIPLGRATNIFRGLNANWDPGAGRVDILYPPADPPLRTTEPTAPPSRGTWDYPSISLHDTPQSLLSALIPYDVVAPAADVHAPELPAGALLMGAARNPEALAEISETIGVDLAIPGRGYALVKLERRDGIAQHAAEEGDVLMHMRPRKPDPALGLDNSFLDATRQLRHAGIEEKQDYGTELDRRRAEHFLEHFARWGTHFVSRIDIGDAIVQVFAFPEQRFARIKKAYADGKNPLSGPGAVEFVYFTTDAVKGEFGYVAEYGAVLCLSNSDRFRTSLEGHDWYEPTFARRDTLFAPFDAGARLTLEALDREFVEQAPTRVQLSPLSLFVEFKRTLLWQRVLQAALAQKYGDSINPNFAPVDDRDFARLLPQDQPGVVSALATPTITVYKSRIDVGDLQLVAADTVKDFTVFGNVVNCSSQGTTLPGQRIGLFGQVIDMRTSGRPVAVEVSDAAYDAMSVACQEFLGAMAVRNRVGSKYRVVADGLAYGLIGEGRDADPIVVGDVRGVPPATALPTLVDGLQFATVLAEAVLGNQSAGEGTGIQGFMRDFLRWLAAFIPAGTSDKQLLALRVRVLDLASYAVDANYGSFVPLLPYGEYREYVERILEYAAAIEGAINQTTLEIEARRQRELVIDVAKQLNENIVQTGELLAKTIEANAAQQQDINRMYDGIIEKQKGEAIQQADKVGKLESALFVQQAEVDAAIQRYKSAVTQWQTLEGIKFGIEVATNLFSLGTSIAVPASSISAVKDLGLLAQRIQKTLNVLNATWKLYSGIATEVDKLKKAQSALDGLDGTDFGSPTPSDWDETLLKFKALLDMGPSDGPAAAAKADLSATFSILVSRGKAVLSAKSAQHQIERDIYTNQLQQEINRRQAARLEALKGALHPKDIKDLDTAKIDLIGLTGHLSFLRDQMLAILAKAFAQQDQALQYANLQPPTLILSYSVLKFREARVRQTRATIVAREALTQHQVSTTTPIEYRIEGVPLADVTRGNTFAFELPLDARSFSQYVDARVVSVVAEVVGVKSTESGRYLVQLTYGGTPFLDRDTQRQPHTYRTPWRERVYEYEAGTNKPRFTDGGRSWSEGVSRVTPFSSWSVAFPDTSTNREIAFEGTTATVVLRFVLEARIVDARTLLQRRLRAGEPGLRLRAAPAAAQVPSTPDLVSAMSAQGACTNGWDVVFNMSLAQIDRVLREQYDALKRDTTYKNTIKVETKTRIREGVYAIKRWDLTYGYPQLSFTTPKETDVRLDFGLTGTLTECDQRGDKPPECDNPVAIDGTTLTAYVAISKVIGTAGGHDVIEVTLDLQTGAFDVNRIEMDPVEKVDFSRAVAAYFATNPVKFLINRLDLTQVPTIEALRPNAFQFKKLTTPSSAKMLQLFIQTGGRSLLDYSQTFLNGVPEPIPQGEECSLMLRSGLLFSSVIPGSLRKGNWVAAGDDPGNPAKAWTGRFSTANVVGKVDMSKLNHSVSSGGGRGGGSFTDYTYWIPGGNDVTWSLEGTKLIARPDGRINLTGSRSNTMKYTQKACTTVYPCLFSCTSCRESDMSTQVDINVNGQLVVDVGGAGREQTIKMRVVNPAGTVTGHMSGGGPSGSDDFAAQVNNEIRNQLPSQITQQLDVPFEAVSVFALKNLLFPTKNYIRFEGGYVPGDLLVVGTFQSG
ncbi:MAG TPA: hypothetical protein VFW71_11760 [Actinomycetota bacterium]|nr:hypothetical protein [Actinomycetota bacterium]